MRMLERGEVVRLVSVRLLHRVALQSIYHVLFVIVPIRELYLLDQMYEFVDFHSRPLEVADEVEVAEHHM
jgi:hypothetical protein